MRFAHSKSQTTEEEYFVSPLLSRVLTVNLRSTRRDVHWMRLNFEQTQKPENMTILQMLSKYRPRSFVDESLRIGALPISSSNEYSVSVWTGMAPKTSRCDAADGAVCTQLQKAASSCGIYLTGGSEWNCWCASNLTVRVLQVVRRPVRDHVKREPTEGVELFIRESVGTIFCS
jgi:hypothetical protein